VTVIAVIVIGALLGFSSPALAQKVSSHTLRVGLLSGEVDYRAFTVNTRMGPLPIHQLPEEYPYRLVHNAQNYLVMALNPANRHKTSVDTIAFRFFSDERDLIGALITEEVDCARLDNEDSAAEVFAANKHYRVFTLALPSNTVTMICYNLNHPLFRNRELRRALTHAIPRKQMIRRYLHQKANLAVGPFDSDSWAFNKSLKSYSFNPKEALRILRDLGWRDSDGDGVLDKNGSPFQFRLFFRKGVLLEEQIAREIKINWNELGIDVIPYPQDQAELQERLRRGDFEAVLYRHRFQEDSQSLRDFWGSNGSKNFVGYRNPMVDRYLALLERVSELERQKSLLAGIQLQLHKDVPVTFLYFKWTYHFLVNARRFSNFIDSKGRVLPFDQWEVLSP